MIICRAVIRQAKWIFHEDNSPLPQISLLQAVFEVVVGEKILVVQEEQLCLLRHYSITRF